jgi:hypothetical protein
VSEQATVSEAELWLERYNAALELGLSDEEAATFATGGDMGELIKLVDGGCPLDLIRQIVT